MLLSGVLCLCQIEQPENTELGTLFAPLFANTTRDIYYRQHAGMFRKRIAGLALESKSWQVEAAATFGTRNDSR